MGYLLEDLRYRLSGGYTPYPIPHTPYSLTYSDAVILSPNKVVHILFAVCYILHVISRCCLVVARPRCRPGWWGSLKIKNQKQVTEVYGPRELNDGVHRDHVLFFYFVRLLEPHLLQSFLIESKIFFKQCKFLSLNGNVEILSSNDNNYIFVNLQYFINILILLILLTLIGSLNYFYLFY